MNIGLWVAAALLAALYLAVGVAKLTRRRDRLRTAMGWVDDFPVVVVRLIGLAEIAGALGLLLPLATDVQPWLTPTAATCLVVLQALAIAVHVRRRELAQLWVNVLLLLAAAFVAVGRFAGW
ncbi:DoxX family protein [Isoptericola sp. NPDC060257]|uniref:DoxX family protein n=1 Tax=Isoptericola sp. NPDC060257 TaxID=3347087 RepID=UPI003660AAFC